MDLLTTTYKDKIEGTLGCFDRIIITGTIPQICYSQGMTSYLYSQKIRIFDYAKFAEPFKEELRANAEEIAKKIWLKKCWINEVIIMDWSIYSLPWKAVIVTNHGTTKRQVKHF